MTTTAITIPDYDVHLLLHDVSWEAYEQLRDDLDAEHRHLRLTYDQGALEIMSPSESHERWKKQLARMVELMSLELRIEIECLGSTTFRRRIRLKGLEPDECYYVQNVARGSRLI
jgi:Uma2 family endonuclease